MAAQPVVSDHLSLVTDDCAVTQLWREAWDQIKGEVDLKKLPEDFRDITKLDVGAQVSSVRREALRRRDIEENGQRRILGSRRTYREAFEKIAKCCQQFQVVGDIVSQADPVHTALPWTFIKFFITCAVGESEVFHTMLDGIEATAEYVTSYTALEQLYASIDSQHLPALQKALLHLYKYVLQFQFHAIKYFDPHKKILRTLKGINPFKQEEIKGRQAAMENARQKVHEKLTLIDAEINKIGIDNLRAGQKGQTARLEIVKADLKALSGEFSGAEIKQQKRYTDLVDMWKRPLDEFRTRFEQERIEKEIENVVNVRQWLSSIEPDTIFQDAQDKRRLPLGSWLVKHNVYLKWRTSGQSSMLWLHGFAGTGKTSLTCRLIQNLTRGEKNKSPQTVASRLAFFFFSSDQLDGANASRSDPDEALRSVVSQLTTSPHARTVFPPVQELFNAHGPKSDNPRKLNGQECVKILQDFARQVSFTIALDAFDECERTSSSEFIDHLKSLIQDRTEATEKVKIFISTRAFPGVEDCLSSDQAIEVTEDNNGEDVKYFIRTTLQACVDDRSLLNGKKVPPDLQARIERSLIRRAGNMFLYASLLLQQLADKNRIVDEESIERKLESLPSNLTEAYDGIVTDVHDKSNSERSVRVAQDSFKWLLHAQRPLEIQAFLEAVSMPDQKVVPDEVLRACRSLIIPGKAAFEFAHYSVREHLSHIETYNESQCHLTATKSCFRILSKTFGLGASPHDLSQQEQSFEAYALLYWPVHFERISQVDMRQNAGEINSMLRSFLLPSHGRRQKFESWYKRAWSSCMAAEKNSQLAQKLGSCLATEQTPLFAACVFGLDDLISKFGREQNELSRRNSYGQSALCLAVENNKQQVVQALLSSRYPAQVNQFNEYAARQFEDLDGKRPQKGTYMLYATALQCAAARGHVEIADYLLSQGAHIDLVAGFYGSALQAAAHNGHYRMVEFLLSKGAEPNSQGGFYGNALQAASAEGHAHIIRLLLEHNPPAVVGTPGGHYGSALMAAICSSNIDIVFALLEAKADPNGKVKFHGLPLVRAIEFGPSHRKIVKELLDSGAKPDLSEKRKAMHLLHKAALYDMQELALYCCDHGCNLSMSTRDGPSYSKKFGEFPDQMTPLAFACAEGHVDMVKLLIKKGAPIERDKDPSAVLWIASYRGYEKVVELLIDEFKAAHPNDASALARFMDQTPNHNSSHRILWAACTSNSPEVVRLLLDNGAKTESNDLGVTPLSATATFGCSNIAFLLLDYHRKGRIDAAIDQRSKRNGRTALFEACEHRRSNIVRHLLDAGADYTTMDKENATTLHMASSSESPEIMKMLVDKAVTEMDALAFLNFLNTQNVSGSTALVECAKYDHPTSLSLLLQHGADPSLISNTGNTALHEAARAGLTESVKILLEKASIMSKDQSTFHPYINKRNKDGVTALFCAAESRNLTTVRYLLERGADYTIGNNHKVTPLHFSSWNGLPEIAFNLIEKALAEPDQKRLINFLNQRNDQGKTALIDASEKRRTSIVKKLLQSGADYTIGNENEETALHHASHAGFPDVVLLLLEYGSLDASPDRFSDFVNHRNVETKTALIDAAETGRHDIASMLIDYGADYSLTTFEGFTALHWSAHRNRISVVRVLLQKASPPERPTYAQEQKFRGFINQRGEKNGATALRDAAKEGHTEVAKMLLSYKADPFCSDSQNRGPIHYALESRNWDLTRVWLQHVWQHRSRVNSALSVKIGPNKEKAWDIILKGPMEVSMELEGFWGEHDSLDKE